MPQGLALLLRQAALLMLWKLLAPAPTAPATSALAGDSCNKLAAVGGLVVCQFVGGVLGVQVGDCVCAEHLCAYIGTHRLADMRHDVLGVQGLMFLAVEETKLRNMLWAVLYRTGRFFFLWAVFFFLWAVLYRTGRLLPL